MTVLRLLLPASLALASLGATAVPAIAQTAPVSAVTATSPATVSADLRTRLHSTLARSSATSFSVAVDVDGLGAVYRGDPTGSLPPASTEKLFTTFAALQAAGPTARLTTLLRSTGVQRGPYLTGSVYLVGGGDPYLTSLQLDGLAAKLRTDGVRRIDGGLVVDDLRYDAVRRAPGWKSSFVPDESGPLSSLALDGNAWRTDTAYIADPGIPTLARFKTMLNAHGISVVGGLHRGRAASTYAIVASHPSASMADLIRRVDKDSDNFGAELLLKETGYQVRGVGSTAAGAAAVRDELRPLAVTVGTMADGSGLSNQDRQTAAGELSLLVAAERASTYSTLRRALPVACRDGTLLHRMCGTAAEGRATAKTGTLPGVYALTGWTSTADGHRVRFSFLLAGATSSSSARAAIDACVVLLSAARTST